MEMKTVGISWPLAQGEGRGEKEKLIVSRLDWNVIRLYTPLPRQRAARWAKSDYLALHACS